jgi:hypothetical protein
MKIAVVCADSTAVRDTIEEIAGAIDAAYERVSALFATVSHFYFRETEETFTVPFARRRR